MPVRALSFVTLLVALALGVAVPVRAQQSVVLATPPALVVMLQSFGPSSGWERGVAGGVSTRLAEGGVSVDLREEFLDTRRHGGKAYLDHVRDVLVAKYASTPPRLVVTCDDAAMNFLLAYPEVFPGVPVVFGGLQQQEFERLPRARMTGVREEFRVDQIVAALIALRPLAARVFVVTEASAAGNTFRQQFAQVATQHPGVRFVALSGAEMPLETIVERLQAEATPDDLVLATVVTRDSTARTLNGPLTMAAFVRASRAPVVGLAYGVRGDGLLALTASTGESHGRLVGAKALQVLTGTSPASIPVDVDSESPLEFDARVMARFGIREDQLPPGAEVVFRPDPTFYQANRGAIWAAAGFIGFQSIIIAGLLLNVARRKRAEALRDDQARALVSANQALEEANRSLIHEQDVRLRAEQDLRHAQKMEAVGRLAGGVAHDFNNLLTVTLGYCELLRARVRDGSMEAEALEQIRKASEQASTLTQNLLAFSRKQVAQPTTVDAARTVRELEPMLRRFCGERVSLALRVDDAPACVELAAGQLEQVVMNLVINGRDAMPDGGRLDVHLRDASVAAEGGSPIGLRSGRHVVLEVRDTGVGMEAATRARVFEPFFTTKETGRGTGLGLATVYAIVTQRGGRIAVESEPGQGSTFTVWMPAVPCPEAPVVAPETPRMSAAQGCTILVVEDETDLRALVALSLRTAGYTVLTASGGNEAYRIAAQHDGRIDMVLTDIVMPEQDGFTVARRLRELRPGLVVAYMSGYTDHADRPGLEPQLLLAKPFLPDDLIAHVRRMLETGRSAGR